MQHKVTSLQEEKETFAFEEEEGEGVDSGDDDTTIEGDLIAGQ